MRNQRGFLLPWELPLDTLCVSAGWEMHRMLRPEGCPLFCVAATSHPLDLPLHWDFDLLLWLILVFQLHVTRTMAAGFVGVCEMRVWRCFPVSRKGMMFGVRKGERKS